MNEQLKTWHFGTKNDALIDLVLSGKKTATTSIYDGSVDEIGSESVLLYDNEKQACITKTIKNIICPFKDVTWELVKLEGEHPDFNAWQKEHEAFFSSIDDCFSVDTLVLVEVFEVTRNLKQERLQIGSVIAENNKDIFGDIESIREINAGFNNHLFDINGKYVIKVCGNDEKEHLFDVEANFYRENKSSRIIPHLYRFDQSKNIVPYVYEIIEKVDGKSVYYSWYKWDEDERESFISNLVQLLSEIHVFTDVKDDWKDKVKSEIIGNYRKCIELFTENEKTVVEKAFDFYDVILSDNHYALIHNDLHFDNILLDENGEIKIIDFNDSIIAPFDFDLRLLFMCQDRPWKWADIEMDPYQKPEDYTKIRSHIKKYYKKLSDVLYLDERMMIYEILNDIRHLPKYKNKEQIDIVVQNSKKILESMKVDLKEK